MKIYISFLLVLILLGLSQTGSAQNNSMNSNDNDERKRTDRIEELAAQIENAYINKLDFSERRKAIGKMDELLRLVRQSNGNYDDRRWKIHTDEEMATLAALIKKTFPFSDQKSVLYQDAMKFNYTVSQTMMIMDVVSFSSEKTEVLKIMYPKIKDKKNSYQLLSNSNYFSIREDIIKIISGSEE